MSVRVDCDLRYDDVWFVSVGFVRVFCVSACDVVWVVRVVIVIVRDLLVNYCVKLHGMFFTWDVCVLARVFECVWACCLRWIV